MAKIHDIRNQTKRTNGTRRLSQITHIARHHSATTSGDFFSFWRHWNGTNGWGTGGYHEIILRDGSVQLCYDPEEITNGVGNHNSYVYHICVVGNGSFTAAQETTFKERCLLNMKRLNIPAERVLGHREFRGASTSCPGADMAKVRSVLKAGKVSAPVSPVDPLEKGYLVYNDRGDSVLALSRRLAFLGYDVDDINYFNAKLKKALMTFQKAQGLVDDGSFGPASQKHLATAVGDMKAAQVAGDKLVEEAITMPEFLKFKTREGNNAALRVLKRFEKKDPALAASWREDLERGELTEAQAIEIFFVAVDRGYITGLVDTGDLLERVEALEKK